MDKVPDTPLFAIITVCFNATATIARTLQSVDSQSFGDYEHLIVDGASRDSTLDIVKAMSNPRRRVISEPDKGIYDAMNKGIDATSGKYLIFLNAGDKFHSFDTLSVIAQAIQLGGSPGVVYGQTIIVDNEGAFVSQRHLQAPENLTVESFADGMLVCHQAFVASRDVAGHYNLKYRFSADYDWCIRCLQQSTSNVGLHETVLIDYLSEGATTQNFYKSLRERFVIMAHYYGFVATALRHVRFLARWRKRRNTNR